MGRPGPCNIAIRDSRLTQTEFMSKFARSQPLVVRDVSNNDLFRALSQKKRLLTDYGHTSITLSAANTHSYEKKVVTFKDYCEKYTGPQRPLTPANETFYMFGDHDYLEWGDLFAEYSPPPYNLPRHKPAYSLGLPGLEAEFHFISTAPAGRKLSMGANAGFSPRQTNNPHSIPTKQHCNGFWRIIQLKRLSCTNVPSGLERQFSSPTDGGMPLLTLTLQSSSQPFSVPSWRLQI